MPLHFLLINAPENGGITIKMSQQKQATTQENQALLSAIPREISLFFFFVVLLTNIFVLAGCGHTADTRNSQSMQLNNSLRKAYPAIDSVAEEELALKIVKALKATELPLALEILAVLEINPFVLMEANTLVASEMLEVLEATELPLALEILAVLGINPFVLMEANTLVASEILEELEATELPLALEILAVLKINPFVLREVNQSVVSEILEALEEAELALNGLKRLEINPFVLREAYSSLASAIEKAKIKSELALEILAVLEINPFTITEAYPLVASVLEPAPAATPASVVVALEILEISLRRMRNQPVLRGAYPLSESAVVAKVVGGELLTSITSETISAIAGECLKAAIFRTTPSIWKCVKKILIILKK